MYLTTANINCLSQINLSSFALVRTNPWNAFLLGQALLSRKLSGAACHLKSVPRRTEIRSLTASAILQQPLLYGVCAMIKNIARSPPGTTFYSPQGLSTAPVWTNTWLSNIRVCRRNVNLCCVMARQQSFNAVRDGKYTLCQPTGVGIHRPLVLHPLGSFSPVQTQ